MPFPLAHPAAVLPLRRWCPHRLNFPALVIGSLTPDAGYFFGRYHVAVWSHSFWIGGIGFCLPVGLLLFWLFQKLRSPVMGALSSPSQQAPGSLARRTMPSLIVLLVSLLIGGWTHILLDSATHPNGWFVKHAGVLRYSIPWYGSRHLQVCDILYYGFTFFGVGWVMLRCLRWFEKVRGDAIALRSPLKWAFVLLAAGGTTLLSVASHSGF